MTVGKQRSCCCGFTQSAWGRISNTFPRNQPAMNPPRCMKLSMRGNSPYTREPTENKEAETMNRVRWCGELAPQLISTSASLAPTKPMEAPEAPTDTRPCTKSTEARVPANPARNPNSLSSWIPT